MNCPGPLLPLRHPQALVPRPARSASPTSAACTASSASGTLAGLTRVRVDGAGRRAHLLHAGAARRRARRVHRDDARGLRRLRLRPRRGDAADAPREVPRPPRAVGRGRGGARARVRARRLRRHGAAGRGRLLRPEDRLRLPRRARAVAGRSPRCRSTAPCPSASSSRYVTAGRRRGHAGDDPSRRAGLASSASSPSCSSTPPASCRSGWRRCRCACCRSARRPRRTRGSVRAGVRRTRACAPRPTCATRSSNYKIREAQLEKIPVLAVVGEREAADGTVAPRIGGENRPPAAARRASWRQTRADSSHAREVPHSQGRGKSPDQRSRSAPARSA